MTSSTASRIPSDARTIGALFLVAFLTYGVGSALALPASEGSGTPHPEATGRVLAGVTLMLTNSAIVIDLGRRLSRRIHALADTEPSAAAVARGYLAARVVEATCLGLGAALSLGIVLGPSQPVETLRGGIQASYQVGMLALALGSLPAWRLLWRTGRVPGWLGGWALAGYLMLGLGCLAELGGLPIGVLCSIPGGLMEATFGLGLLFGARWLIPTAPAASATAFPSD